MPWAPELFSTPTLERVKEKRRRDRALVMPYFDGLLAGEIRALVESFAGEPEVHHPVRGRIRGAKALEAYMVDTNNWLAEKNATVEDVELTLTDERGVEEVVIHLEGDGGRIALPVAIVTDHSSRKDRIEELRVYYSSWPLSGAHAIRPPLLQPDTNQSEPDVVGEYQRALAAGDTDAILATFEPDAYAREPAGGEYVHRGSDGLRGFYEHLFSNGGGIPLEHCTVTDDGRACALEYNVVRWGRDDLPPQAGVAVYVRGESGKLAAARIYDDADPPLT